nr:MAG TPA: hypothetical protein [Caudoviricetes sp.]
MIATYQPTNCKCNCIQMLTTLGIKTAETVGLLCGFAV